MNSPRKAGGRSFIVPDITTETLKEDENTEKERDSEFSLFFFPYILFLSLCALRDLCALVVKSLLGLSALWNCDRIFPLCPLWRDGRVA
jgi:hypothetical protein